MGTANTARGDALRAAREAKPWTQAQLAAAALVSPRTVIRAEAGGDATAETLMALCGALGINADALPTGVEPAAEAGAIEDDVPSGKAPPTVVTRLAGIPGKVRRILAGAALASLCAASWHVAWAGTLAWETRNLPTMQPQFDGLHAVLIAGNLAAAGRAVATGTPVEGVTWDEIFNRRTITTMRDCPNRGFVDFLSGDINPECPAPMRSIGIYVLAAGPELVEVTVGPMRRRGLGSIVRMLPRDPRLRVTAGYSAKPKAPDWGFLRFEPNALTPDQVPQAPEGLAYLHVRIEPKESTR